MHMGLIFLKVRTWVPLRVKCVKTVAETGVGDGVVVEVPAADEDVNLDGGGREVTARKYVRIITAAD